MLLRLQNSYASMDAMVRQQERIANNLANAGTIGYKRDRSFTETLNEFLDAEQAPRSDRNHGQWASMEQGALEKTGNPLDVALKGDGFFVLADAETGAQRYSRAGRFEVDVDGFLRDPAGFQVEGADGPIQIPPNAADIEIKQDGEILADGQSIGRLRVVTFEDPKALVRLDAAAFDAADQEPEDVETPSIAQGHLEQSNIDPIHEMTAMIEHFRLFETQQKVLQTNDQVLGSVVRDLGKF